MLPRNLKNKQTIIKNESDDEDERTVQHQTINVYKDKISTKNLSTILPKSNSTIPLKAEHSLKAPEKKPRYIVPN